MYALPELEAFYQTPIGDAVAASMRAVLDDFLQDIPQNEQLGRTLVSGYPYHLLPTIQTMKAERRLLHIPYGLLPQDEAAQDAALQRLEECFVAEGEALPLETASIDTAIMVHALEFTPEPHAALQELWRVLKSNGVLLLIVPNRMGFWARAEWSPFGHGQPFSMGQLEDILIAEKFKIERAAYGLHIPPLQSKLILKRAGAWNAVCSKLLYPLGGFQIISAVKHIYANVDKGNKAPAFLKPALKPKIATARMQPRMVPPT